MKFLQYHPKLFQKYPTQVRPISLFVVPSMIPALHILQFDHALLLEQLYSIVKHGAEVRPVTIFLSDGRPDKNPGFLITLDVAAQHSKKNNFDALPISIMLQKMSAYNQVGQKMALFSKASAGLVLPHGTFGLHLDFQR